MQVMRATAIQKLLKNVLKLKSVHQFVAIFKLFCSYLKLSYHQILNCIVC